MGTVLENVTNARELHFLNGEAKKINKLLFERFNKKEKRRKQKMINKPREIALKTIYKINQEQAYSNLALDEELKQNRKILNEKDYVVIQNNI